MWARWRQKWACDKGEMVVEDRSCRDWVAQDVAVVLRRRWRKGRFRGEVLLLLSSG